MAMAAPAWVAAATRAKKDNVKPGMLTEERCWSRSGIHGHGGKRRWKGSAISKGTVRFTDPRKRCAMHQKGVKETFIVTAGTCSGCSRVTFRAKYTGSTSLQVGKRRSRSVLS